MDACTTIFWWRCAGGALTLGQAFVIRTKKNTKNQLIFFIRFSSICFNLHSFEENNYIKMGL